MQTFAVESPDGPVWASLPSPDPGIVAGRISANLCSTCSTPTASSLPTPASAASPGRSTSRPGRCRSSAPTATSTRGAGRRHARSATRPSSWSPGTTTCCGCSTARASRWRRSGSARATAAAEVADGRSIWRTFAEHYHLFRATPSKLWLDHTLVRGVRRRRAASAPTTPTPSTTTSSRAWPTTTSGPGRSSTASGSSSWPRPTPPSTRSRPTPGSAASGWAGRVVPTFRPDDVVDPDRPDFGANLDRLAELDRRGHHDLGRLPRRAPGPPGRVHRRRRHGQRPRPPHGRHRRPRRAPRPRPCSAGCGTGEAEPGDAELFRAQMLVEMAAMSLDDGLVLQLHAGSWRGHNPTLADRFGPRQGRRHPQADGLRRRAQAAARPVRQRAVADRRRLHPRREHLQPGAGPARRPLPGAAPRTAVVVPRQPRGHPPVPPAGHRDGRLRQHRRLQRRRPLAARRSRPATTWPAGSTPASSPAWWPKAASREDEAAEVAEDLAYGLARRAFRVARRLTTD